jgi:hypothetical protein
MTYTKWLDTMHLAQALINAVYVCRHLSNEPAQCEKISSGVRPKADINRSPGYVAEVPTGNIQGWPLKVRAIQQRKPPSSDNYPLDAARPHANPGDLNGSAEARPLTRTPAR